MTDRTKFRILHCLRAPVGGLFRHVCDLAAAQSRLGHEVAIICADTGDALTSARLHHLAELLHIGVHRIPMSRNPGFGDAIAARHVLKLARKINADVLHGHGAKGGAYARLAAHLQRQKRLCLYTPHGGSLHYVPTSTRGRVFMALERRLERMTDGIIFESAFAAERYATQVGRPRAPSRVIPNGVLAEEFEPITHDADASNFVFVGELRHLKGIDVLLEALAMVNRTRRVTATIVGSGPDAAQFKALVSKLGLEAVTRFTGALPARTAFKMGHVLIMPSRAESFPYIILEAGAAGLPVITTRVGGIPEITGESGTPLLMPGDVEALTAALFDALDSPDVLGNQALALRQRIARHFTVESMTKSVMCFYAHAAALSVAKRAAGRALLTTD